MRSRIVVAVSCLCVAFVAMTASSTVFEPLTDRDLVKRADAVVEGLVLDSQVSRVASGAIVTTSRIRVNRVLKGDVSANEVLTVREYGGAIDGKTMFIVASARYVVGEQVLAFLGRDGRESWHTTSMSRGRFAFRRDAGGREIVLRSTDGESDERPRLARQFERFIEDVNEGRDSATSYFVAPAAQTLSEHRARAESFTAAAYAWNVGPGQARIKNGETGSVAIHYALSGTIAGADATQSAAAATAAWTAAPNNNLSLDMSGTPGTDPSTIDGHWTIYLSNQASAPPALCDAAMACAVIWLNSDPGFSHTFEGSTFLNILEGDIYFKSTTLSQAALDVIMTHELGHTIGLRHADDAVQPSTTQAVMASTTNVSFGTTLQPWDRDAMATMYGTGPPCYPPSNTSVWGGGTVTSGQTVTFTVTAQGSDPITYQWYQGSSGDTSTQVGTGTSFTTPPVTTSLSYWVLATNACGSDKSAAVTVSPAACKPPAILKDPSSQTITSGQTATLTVGYSGSDPVTFQWYQGESGNTTKPISGATDIAYTTPALTTTTSYWVKVSNGCGSANSATATITVPGTCASPVLTQQPQSNGVPVSGGPIYLFAAATNATGYQWYQGTAGDTTNPLVSVTTSAAQWVDAIWVDLLGVNPDGDSRAAGYVARIAAAEAGGGDASALKASIAREVMGFSGYAQRVLSIYYSTYVRVAMPEDFRSFYTPSYMSGDMSDEVVISWMMATPEYFNLAGGTNSGFVTLLFNDILGRAPTAAELAVWSSSGLSRQEKALSVLTSTEAQAGGQQMPLLLQSFLGRKWTSADSGVGATSRERFADWLGKSGYGKFATMALVPQFTAGTSFWVAVSNSCGTTNSTGTAVSNPPCSAPVITTQPQSVGINLGDVPPLSVVATGNGLTYQWYSGSSGDTSHAISGSTAPALNVPAAATASTATYWVKVSNNCASTNSSTATVVVNCAVSKPPVLATRPSASSGASYPVSWTVSASVYDHFELQESTSADFASPTTFTTTSTTYTIPAHTVSADTRFYYRVRGFLTCSGTTPQEYSAAGSTLVNAPPPPNPPSLSISNGCIVVNGKCFVAGQFSFTGPNPPPIVSPAADKPATPLDATSTYTVTADEPWITFSPSSGTVTSGGSVTVDYSVDATNLPTGSTGATVTVNFSTTTTTTSGKPVVLGTTTSSSNIPLSVNLVSPVSPTPKTNNPPANSMIIPAVAHATGINSQFVSDLRLVNTALQSVTYNLIFTPAGSDGTQSGKSFQLTIGPGETKAINDIVQTWFGAGAAGEGGLGTVEIRPSNYLGKVGVSLTTVAASRTYNVTPSGTFGQFIPAIPILNFLRKSETSKISLQQVAQSSAYRTNLGLVEGSGQPVSLELRLLDSSGKLVMAVPWTLKPYEFQQQSFGTLFPNVSLNDGRVEVRVTSDTGSVSAYASVLDNKTSDPLAVFPVQPDQIRNSRYVVPGVADLNGAANFHTDMRIFNGGSSPVTATATYVPQAGSPAASAPLNLTIGAGEVKVLDDTLKSQFNVTNSGGAVVVTTPTDSSLVVTARTFSRRDDGGTFGQFIPGVTSSDGVGSSERALQVIQLEQSPSFRSNVGLVELTGNAVNVRVRGYSPDSKVSAIVDVALGPNEFRQIGSIFSQMGYGNTYNGRVTVEVTGGSGRVTAYGSVIDNRTQDPTYVPAQ